MKMTTIVDYWQAIAVCLVFASLGVVTARAENGDSADARTNTAVRAVLSMPVEAASTQTITQIRGMLRGNENAAVAFALKHIGSSDGTTDRGCIRIMAALEQETLAQYIAKDRSGPGLDDRDRRALGRWGRYVSTPGAMDLVIANLLDNTNAAEEVDARMVGEQRRFCDVAFNLALDRIQGISESVGKAPLGTLDTIDARNERLARFRQWWKLNSNRLEWSEDDRRFRVKTSQ
jgi:hypothetical protein